MEKKIKHVALYPRKSRDNSDSLEGQLASLIEYCVRFNWTYEVFAEEGSASSEDWNREQLQNLIRKIELQHFDAVVVTEQSRISRSDDFPKFRNVLQEANCYFVTTQTNSIYDYNKPEDEFVSDIMTAVNKQEIAFTKLRLKRGTIQAAKKGRWMGKKNPIGYQYNRTKKILEVTSDAPIIRRMFQEYLDGLSTTSIAHKFTMEGVTTSVGMLWSPAGVSRLLNNPVYKGASLYGRTTKKNGKRGVKTKLEDQILIEDTHEAIVSKEIWDEVQQLKLKRNSRPASLKQGKHKYSGLIVCSICGATHSFQHSKGGKKRINSCQTRHYQENSVTKYTVCENKGANVEEFERLFIPYVSQYADQLEQYIDLIKSQESPKNSHSEDRFTSIDKQLKKINQDIKRVQQGFLMEIFTDEEAEFQIKGFKLQKESLEKELAQLQETTGDSEIPYYEKVLSKIRRFLNGYNDMPESKLNEELRDVTERIVYTRVGEGNPEMNIKVVWK